MAESKQLEYGKWAIFIAVLLVLWTILKKFGVVGPKTPKELAEEKEEQQEVEATNLNLDIDFKEWTNPKFYKKPAPAGYSVAVLPMKLMDEIVDGLYDSFSYTATSIITFGIVQDNEQQMLANIKKINYKTAYSAVADRYEQRHKEDLTSTLKKYFNEEELYPAWRYLNSLPTYKKK